MAPVVNTYRNVTVDGDTIEGERTIVPGGDFYKFSGCLPLLRISTVLESEIPKAYQRVYYLNSFGMINGYDWSFVRDSQPEDIVKMDAMAQKIWAEAGQTKWPWEINTEV